jgi:hypothetical protein
MRRTTATSFVLPTAAALLGAVLLAWSILLATGWTTQPVNSVLWLFQAVLMVAIGGAFATRPPTPPPPAVATELRYRLAA